MKLNHGLICIVAGLALAGASLAQPYGMGPGMGGFGPDYGMGPGMMGGHRGGPGYGPGMMDSLSSQAYAGLDLTPDQRKKILEIQQETSRAMWQLMGTMHEQRGHMQGMYGLGSVDEAEARKSFQAMADAQKAMFEMQLDARKRVQAVLTADQREKLQRYWSGR